MPVGMTGGRGAVDPALALSVGQAQSVPTALAGNVPPAEARPAEARSAEARSAGVWPGQRELREMLAVASRAPSMYNTQPWLFRIGPGRLDVRADASRRLPVADPSGWAVRVSCGAVLFNLRLALAMNATPALVKIMPDHTDPTLVARLTPDSPRPATPVESRLYRAIPRRQTNRFPFDERPVSVAVRAQLIEAARAEAGWLDLVLGPAGLDLVAVMARAADDVLRRDDRYTAEARSWIRKDIAADGVPVAAGGPAPLAFELLARRDFGGFEPSTREYEREPLVAVLGVAGDAPADQVRAGQVLQRVLLTAADAGLASSMLSQPIEVPAVREQLRLALGRGGVPQLLLRFGYALAAPATGRRPVHEMVVVEER